MRTGAGAIKISLESTTALNESTYTVNFLINDESVSSTWILEYGIWRISTFGTDVVGDKTIVEKQETKRAEDRDLYTDYELMIQAGVSFLLNMEKTIGFNAGFRFGFGDYFLVGGDFTLNGEYKQIQAALGAKYAIRLGSVAIIPLAEAGVNLGILGNPMDFEESSGFGLGWGIKAGFMFTTKFVQGLYLFGNYQYNAVTITDDQPIWDPEIEYKINTHSITIGIGFGF
jgi:opacity protein-like surface antigen